MQTLLEGSALGAIAGLCISGSIILARIRRLRPKDSEDEESRIEEFTLIRRAPERPKPRVFLKWVFVGGLLGLGAGIFIGLQADPLDRVNEALAQGLVWAVLLGIPGLALDLRAHRKRT